MSQLPINDGEPEDANWVKPASATPSEQVEVSHTRDPPKKQ